MHIAEKAQRIFVIQVQGYPFLENSLTWKRPYAHRFSKHQLINCFVFSRKSLLKNPYKIGLIAQLMTYDRMQNCQMLCSIIDKRFSKSGIDVRRITIITNGKKLMM